MTQNAIPANALIGIWRVVLSVTLVLALYFGQDVLIPAALATLLAFVLSPLVTKIERWIGRAGAVLIVVAILFTLACGGGWILARQLADLGAKLPDYRANIENRIHAFRLPSGVANSRLFLMLKELGSEFPGAIKPGTASKNGANGNPATKDNQITPMPVEIVPTPATGAFELAKKTVVFFLGPLGKGALVLLFLIFFLMQWEDIRGRLIRLAGQGNISATTLAMGDAGERLARYLRYQLLVNIAYAVCITVGLSLMGIPNAILWGGLAGVLRFIPYVGPWLGAAPPVALALAISPAWMTPLLVLALFIGVELVNANALEPWLYGSVTGVTPVALVVGAVFWASIWGPIGLLLTTPLMVCLVVVGRHVPQFGFLSILFSDEQPLSPPQECYHRLLADETDEASVFVTAYLKDHPLAAVYDDILIPVLTMAELDYRCGSLDEWQRKLVFVGVREIIHDLGETPDSGATLNAEQDTNREPPFVIGLVLRSERDELSGLMLLQLLKKKGAPVSLLPPNFPLEELFSALNERPPEAVCILATAPVSVIQARRLMSNIRAQFPKQRIVVGLWGASKQANVEQILQGAGAAGIFYKLAEAVHFYDALHGERNPGDASP